MSKITAPRLLIAVAFLAIIGIMCGGVSLPFANTVTEWSPGAQVAANATATAIAPAVYPTVSYNETVLPQIQAEEAAQAVQTVSNSETWRRNVNTVKSIATISVFSSIALGIMIASVGIGAGIGTVAAAVGTQRMRYAMLPPTRQLAEGPHVTRNGITHTVTGAVWRIDAPQDAIPDHARLASATYEAVPASTVAQLLAAVSSGEATGAQRAQVRYLMDGE